MATRAHGPGLSAYLGHSVFDLDINAIRESHSRPYLEHRLAQVEWWLAHLGGQFHARHHARTPLFASPEQGREWASAAMDMAYLQAVRQALRDALKAL